MFSWFLRSLTRGSLKVVPRDVAHHEGCGLRRSPGLAVLLAGDLPAALPVVCDERYAAVACQHFSKCDREAIDSHAIQSRGGDGISCECNRDAVARLPEHEVCGDCRGHGRLKAPGVPAVDYSNPQPFLAAG